MPAGISVAVSLLLEHSLQFGLLQSFCIFCHDEVVDAVLYVVVHEGGEVVNGESIPTCETPIVGDRYLTEEYVSVYGMLYNYEAVKKIACNLNKANSPWRIPTIVRSAAKLVSST